MRETPNSDYNIFSSTTGNISFNEKSLTATEVSYIPYFINNIENEKGKYSILDIANWFLMKESMTHKKLQKLCYYAQAWCYALKGYKLADTSFEAWIHGPVSPVLYERFKDFGFDTIQIKGNFKPHFDQQDLEILESVWVTYGGHTGNALEALSHSELPWREARVGYAPDERCSIPISPQVMISYYRSIYTGDKN